MAGERVPGGAARYLHRARPQVQGNKAPAPVLKNDAHGIRCYEAKYSNRLYKYT